LSSLERGDRFIGTPGFQITIDTRIESSHRVTTGEPDERQENEGQKIGPAGNE
jgi:hypothetical protein